MAAGHLGEIVDHRLWGLDFVMSCGLRFVFGAPFLCACVAFSANRRVLAASWLQEMVGITSLPNEPSEEEFRLCLRNGLILCNAINKVHPGAVPKVCNLGFALELFIPNLKAQILIVATWTSLFEF